MQDKLIGWTMHHRKRWEKGYHHDPLLWLLMDYFIDFANHEDGEIYFPNVGKIPVKRGQHVFGTRKLAEFLRVDRGVIRRKLKILKNIGFLTHQTTHHYTLATIINYNKYQKRKIEDDPPNDPQTTRGRPADDPQTTTNNNNKKKEEGKEGKEGKKTKGDPSPPSQIEYPSWLNLDLWNEFKAHRKELKAPMSRRAENLNLNKLEGLINQGFSQEEIINQSICNGWKGLFPVNKSGKLKGDIHSKIVETGKRWKQKTKTDT